MTSRKNQTVLYDESLLTDDDISLLNGVTNFRLYEKLGSHPAIVDEAEGTHFAVYAPNALSVSVTGEFNDWNKSTHPLRAKGNSGIWEGFIPGVGKGAIYKYHIVSRLNDYRVDKTDPFAFHTEISPKTSSIVWDIEYSWEDEAWMRNRRAHNSLESPMSIYEVHLGSWMRVQEEDNRFLTYREITPKLADYLEKMGFTHVEIMPITEHPFYGSWGYQTTGYFAPTSRFGTPQDFMYLIDYLHQRGIGVILDWVPSHFPGDEYALPLFDGTPLFEHSDPRQGFHPDWGSYIYDYGQDWVRSFLINSALFWLDKYHADGLRVDGVASMLYLDFSRKEGEWIPNKYGGRENLEAVEFLRQLNTAVYEQFPDVQTFAEESTAWPMVSRPVDVGGLGFGMKWDMGWMNDTLDYMSKYPADRKYHHNKLTFRMVYAFNENFTLPLSHDEVVYGKGSLLGKMPGEDSRKFANLRLLLGYMYASPGKKLLFMGGEFGQLREWNHDSDLDWNVLDYPLNQGLQCWVKELNHVYRNEPALYEQDNESEGFEWLNADDSDNSTISFIRKAKTPEDSLVVVANFAPDVRRNHRTGVPQSGFWQEILNSDTSQYGGSNQDDVGGLQSDPISYNGQDQSVSLDLPPLSVMYLKHTS